MTPKEKRNTVELLVIQIVAKEDDLEIEFVYFLGIEEMGKSGPNRVL